MLKTEILFRWNYDQSDALNRARRDYAIAVCDALDRLAGAQELDRLAQQPCRGGVDWHTLLAHRIAAEGR